MIPPLFSDLVVSCPGASRRCRAASKEVPGGQGKPRTPERWPESCGRDLDDDFLIEAFSCQVWLFSVLLGRLQVVPGGVELCPTRFQEVRGSPELQNGGLRALEEAWDDFLIEAFSRQVWSFSVLLKRPGGLVSIWVPGGPRSSGEAQSPRTVA